MLPTLHSSTSYCRPCTCLIARDSLCLSTVSQLWVIKQSSTSMRTLNLHFGLIFHGCKWMSWVLSLLSWVLSLRPILMICLILSCYSQSAYLFKLIIFCYLHSYPSIHVTSVTVTFWRTYFNYVFMYVTTVNLTRQRISLLFLEV